MREVVASAPAKVNLTLRVGAPDTDGYHPLVSVFEALDVRETVSVRTARAPGIRVTTDVWNPDGTRNTEASALMDAMAPDKHLAARAVRVLQRLAATGPWAATAAGVAVHVDKRIPIAGGMAGGSADAAAALVACNALWELGLTGDQLEAIGRTLGADVPACLVGGIALGIGRGDHMRVLERPHEDVWCHHWVIATAHRGLSTPEVFAAFDEASEQRPSGTRPVLTEPDEAEVRRLTGSAGGLAGGLVNDLEDVATDLRPELADVERAAREAGALDAVLCGSGSSVAALVANDDDARVLAETWERHPDVASVLVARGPAAGARCESEGNA